MPDKTNIPMSQVREMHELYQQGALMKDVGKRFGISESRVSALFKRAGLQSRHPRPPAGGYPVAEMYETYQGGAAMDEVAKQFGVSKPTISKLFKAAGLKTRPAVPPKDNRRLAEMYELYQRGATYHEVGEQFGIGGSRVGQLFSEAGYRLARQANPEGATSRPVLNMHDGELYASFAVPLSLSILCFEYCWHENVFTYILGYVPGFTANANLSKTQKAKPQP
jgi:transposase